MGSWVVLCFVLRSRDLFTAQLELFQLRCFLIPTIVSQHHTTIITAPCATPASSCQELDSTLIFRPPASAYYDDAGVA